jgi:hypothetical protein
MGAIARAAANNITTSGVFTADAITNASVTGITVLAGVSDGITLISSQTASNSATVSFTTGLTSTYKAYKFVFVNINPATNETDFLFNLSTDSGSNYNVAKTSTYFNVAHTEAGILGQIGYDTDGDLAQGTGFQQLGFNIGNGSDESLSGSLTLFNPSSTTYVKHFIAVTQYLHQADRSYNDYSAGYGNTTSAVNAIQFKFDSGNFDGTIYLYGIK